MLLQERSPFSMLPAPLNIIPTALSFWHRYHIRKAQGIHKSITHKEKKELRAQAQQRFVDRNKASVEPESPLDSHVPIDNGPARSRPGTANSTVNRPGNAELSNPESPRKPPKERKRYVLSIAGSASDDVIK
jgi:hypothetical protein